MRSYFVLPAFFLFVVSCSDNKPAPLKADSMGDTVAVKKIVPRVYLYPYLKGKKWGFADTAGKLVIPADFDEAYEMHDGYAVVGKGDSLAIIDSSGKFTTGFSYTYISNFTAKLAVFGRKGKYGAISGEGKEVLPAEFMSVQVYSNGMIVAQIGDKNYSCFDHEGHLLLKGYAGIRPNTFQSYFEVQNTKGDWGIVDMHDSIVIPVEYDYFSGGYYGWKSDKLVAVKNKKYGLIDMKNNVLIPFDYESLNHFEDEGLVVMNKKGKYGVGDLHGRMILPMEYDESINIISRDTFIVSRKGNYGIIDSTGKEIVPMVFEWLYRPSEGLICARHKTPKGNDFCTGFIDFSGDTVVPFGNYWSLLFNEEVAPAEAYVPGKKGRKERLAGVINRKGEVIIPYRYRVVHEFEHGVALVMKNDSLFFMTKSGKEFREK